MSEKSMSEKVMSSVNMTELMLEPGDSCPAPGYGVAPTSYLAGGNKTACGCCKVCHVDFGITFFLSVGFGLTIGVLIALLEIGLYKLGLFPSPFYGRRRRRRPRPSTSQNADNEPSGQKKKKWPTTPPGDKNNNPAVQDAKEAEPHPKQPAKPKGKKQRKIHVKRMKLPELPRRPTTPQPIQSKQAEDGQPLSRAQRRNQKNKLQRMAKRAGALVKFMKSVQCFLLKNWARLTVKIMTIIRPTPNPRQFLTSVLRILKLKRAAGPKQTLSAKKIGLIRKGKTSKGKRW